MHAIVQIAEMQKAVGQAAILLSGDRGYFDAELGAVLPRIIIAAQAQQILFAVDTEKRLVTGFAAFAFLTHDVSFRWRHRLITPGPGDINAGNNCWLTDYVWSDSKQGSLLINGARERWPDKTKSVLRHNFAPTYPEHPIVTAGE